MISEDGKYRYLLTRQWGPEPASVLWVMLNPSTADAEVDDQTIRKCIGFTKLWGYDGLRVVNLFAYRSTDPQELLAVDDPMGSGNKRIVESIINASEVVVLAWGATLAGKLSRLNVEAMVRKAGLTPLCLGKTKDGHPCHPRTLAYATELQEF